MSEPDLLTPEAPAATAPAPNLYDLLRKRHEGGEWVLLEEVAPRTGGGTRYADAVAVNLWHSRGHAIHGFEVKVSRSDWLRELKQPEKAEPVFRYCNAWWIVALKGIVKPGELPPTWGLLEPRGGVLAVSVQAPPLKPVPVDLPFFASLVRRAFESIDRRAGNMVRDQLTRDAAAERQRIDEAVQRKTREASRALAAMAEFEKKTGMALHDWQLDSTLRTLELAKKLNALGGYQRNEFLGRLTSTAGDLERMAATLREAAATPLEAPHADAT